MFKSKMAYPYPKYRPLTKSINFGGFGLNKWPEKTPAIYTINQMDDTNTNPNFVLKIALTLRNGVVMNVSRNAPVVQYEEDEDCIEYEVGQDILTNGLKVSSSDNVSRKDSSGYSDPYFYPRDVPAKQILGVEVTVEERDGVL